MQEAVSKKAILYVFICILLWSLLSVFAKFAQTSLSNHQYLFYSSIISFLSVFAISIYTKKIKELFSYKLNTLLFLCFLGFLDYLFYLLLYFGYKYSNGLEVLVIQYTWPIFIVLFSVFILKESLTKNRIFSLFFGFFGAVLIMTKGDISTIDLSNMKTISLVLVAAASFALFSVLSKKIKIDPINAVMLYFFVSVFYSFISMNVFSNFVIPSKNELFFIFINGFFINGISYIFWIKALQKLNASFVAPFIFLIPIISMFLLIIFFDEKVYFIYFVGLFFIIIAGLINTLTIKNKKI